MWGRGKGCDKRLKEVRKKEGTGCRQEEGEGKAGRSEEARRYMM